MDTETWKTVTRTIELLIVRSESQLQEALEKEKWSMAAEISSYISGLEQALAVINSQIGHNK